MTLKEKFIKLFGKLELEIKIKDSKKIKYVKRFISKEIHGLVFVKDNRFKKHYIVDLCQPFNNYSLEYFDYHRIYSLDKFNKNMVYKYKRWGITNGKIEDICSALEYFENEHVEEFFYTKSLEEIKEMIKIKNLEKQMLEDTKHMSTAKTKLLKF